MPSTPRCGWPSRRRRISPTKVYRFLDYFGLRREQAELARLIEQQPDNDSAAYFTAQCNCGEQLLYVGQINDVVALFQTLLAQLGETPSHWRAHILGLLGRCFQHGRRMRRAWR